MLLKLIFFSLFIALSSSARFDKRSPSVRIEKGSSTVRINKRTSSVKIDKKPSPPKLDKKFLDFIKQFNKNYTGLSDAEILIRQQNFLNNFKLIEKHNAKYKQERGCRAESSHENRRPSIEDQMGAFQLGINEHADVDRESFVNGSCGSQIPPTSRSLPSIFPSTNPPFSAIDWRIYAQPIVNQGSCGSCWAFASIAVLGELKMFVGFI